jgi:hypothetical protein
VITTVLSFPDGTRQDVLLAGVPRVGDSVRLRGNGASPPLLVQHVLWMEITGPGQDATVILEVRPLDNQGGS